MKPKMSITFVAMMFSLLKKVTHNIFSKAGTINRKID